MAKSFMGNGDILECGEELRSDNDKFNLRMQDDGNLVLYCEGVPIWATRDAIQWHQVEIRCNIMYYSMIIHIRLSSSISFMLRITLLLISRRSG